MKVTYVYPYLCRDIVYIPTLYRAEAGFHVARDPVCVLGVADTAALQETILAYWRKGNTTIPTPPPRGGGKPAILKHTPFRSYSAFEDVAIPWSLGAFEDGRYEISIWRKQQPRGWTIDMDRIIKLPPGTTFEEAAGRAVTEIQAKARELRGAASVSD
jgi:hypothetical protein